MAKPTSAGDDPATTGGTPVEEMSYTDASAELDSIVGFFEQREVDVDQLVSRLVRATAIIEELDSRLRRTRVQVEQLLPRLGAAVDDAEPDDASDQVPPADAPRGARSAPGRTAGEAESNGRSDGRAEPGLF